MIVWVSFILLSFIPNALLANDLFDVSFKAGSKASSNGSSKSSSKTSSQSIGNVSDLTFRASDGISSSRFIYIGGSSGSPYKEDKTSCSETEQEKRKKYLNQCKKTKDCDEAKVSEIKEEYSICEGNNSQLLKLRNSYFSSNYDLIRDDTARGKGYYLGTFLALYFCNDVDVSAAASFLKKNYTKIYRSKASNLKVPIIGFLEQRGSIFSSCLF